MQFPKELKYQKTDEWVKTEGDFAIVGITDYAQDSLSDIVYIELTVEVGETVAVGDTLATVESVKAAADVNMPVSGEVVEVNEALADTPEILNSDPFGKGWMIKIKLADPADLDALMDAEAYQKFCQDR